MSSTVTTWIFIGGFVLLVLWVIMVYNGLVAMRQRVSQAFSDIENKIAAARRFFNNAVQEYNTGIQQFPAVLMAGALGFTQKEFFDVGVDERKVLEQAPQVKF